MMPKPGPEPEPEQAAHRQDRAWWRAVCAEAMPSPHWSDARFRVAAVLAAVPCGYASGVVAAYLLAGGPNIGWAPLVTVPLALLATVAFALLPVLEAEVRFMMAAIGAITATSLFLMVRLAFA
jgi:hypothetical protein